MSNKWKEQEDQCLYQWMERGQKKNWKDDYIFHFIAQKLGRTVVECQGRLQHLSKQPGWKINDIEARIDQQQLQIEQLLQENEKLKRDLRVYESVLFEQYQLVLRILGDDGSRYRIQS